jgi:hypothetical protein
LQKESVVFLMPPPGQVTMKEFANTLEAIKQHTIVPELLLYPACQVMHSAIQELAGFLDVSCIPSVKVPRSFRLCIDTKSPSTRHEDHPCNEDLL